MPKASNGPSRLRKMRLIVATAFAITGMSLCALPAHAATVPARAAVGPIAVTAAGGLASGNPWLHGLPWRMLAS